MDIGVKVPDILLPEKNVDYQKWAVVACDQFTSEPAYWEQLERFVGDSPSTLRITFPEIYLGKDDNHRISGINCTMEKYRKEDVLAEPLHGFLLVCREIGNGRRRLGLILSVDLERYSYRKGEEALIRATEGTILSRIPPRVKIRENATLELPHIMLLIDDEKRSVIEPLYAKKAELKKVYDFTLNMGGGRISGWKVEDTEPVMGALAALLNPERLTERYQSKSQLLFAVGDGNHSLAAAKACWEQKKAGLTEQERENHPARFALCEVVNIYDEGLDFEPIHRVVFGASGDFSEKLLAAAAGPNRGKIIAGGGECELRLPESAADAVDAVQKFLDSAAEAGLIQSLDYVHGEDSVREIVAKNPGSVGILLPAMKKSELFSSVVRSGALPRKTFSMGEAREKRYYLECRKIV